MNQQNQRLYSRSRLWAYCFAICLGSLQFGYALGIYNPLSKFLMAIYHYKCGDCWDVHKHREPLNTIVNTALAVGALLGATFSHCFMKDRRLCGIYAYCIFCMVGSALYLVMSLPTLIAARILHGFGAGGFSHLVPIMVYEISPPAMRVGTGYLFQVTVNFGIMLASLFAFGLPSNIESVYLDEWMWRVIIICPICVGGFMLVIFATIYRMDTPVVYLKEDNLQKARQALVLVYHANGVQRRVQQLIFELDRQNKLLRSSSSTNNGFQKLNKYSSETLKGNVKKAVFVGIMLMIFQQLTGISAIIFYSTQLFEKENNPEDLKQGYEISNILNTGILVGSLLAGFYIGKAGRKPLLLVGEILMMIFLILTGVFQFYSYLVLEKVTAALFVASFCFSLGPVVPAYLPEILNPGGVQAAIMVNWVFIILISILIPQMTKLHAQMYFMLAGFCLCGFIFIFGCVIESKGLSRAQLQYKYSGSPSNNYSQISEQREQTEEA